MRVRRRIGYVVAYNGARTRYYVHQYTPRPARESVTIRVYFPNAAGQTIRGRAYAGVPVLRRVKD